ncbi:MAG: AAA family ATPase [Flavobacteriales bacterium]
MEKNIDSGIIRIAITGPESTGKSALAESLAQHYHAKWIPEYAREYLQKNGPAYSFDDITHIAMMQQDREQSASKQSDLIFCDTDALVCKIWQEYVFGRTAPLVQDWFEKTTYTYTLLCNIDLPWEPDPLREHPNEREELFILYERHLMQHKRPFGIVNGQGYERLVCAINLLQNVGIKNFNP